MPAGRIHIRTAARKFSFFRHAAPGGKDVADNVNLHHICCAGDAKRHTRRDGNQLTAFHKARVFRRINGVIKQIVRRGFFFDEKRGDAPGEVELAADARLRAEADDRTVRAEF